MLWRGHSSHFRNGHGQTQLNRVCYFNFLRGVFLTSLGSNKSELIIFTAADFKLLPYIITVYIIWSDPLGSPGRVAQSVGHLTRKSGSVRYPVWPHTFVSPSADSRGAVVSYWRKYVHEVLVNRLGGLSLPRKSVVRLTDRPDMTLNVYRGRKTTTQQQPPLGSMGPF